MEEALAELHWWPGPVELKHPSGVASKQPIT